VAATSKLKYWFGDDGLEEQGLRCGAGRAMMQVSLI